LDRVGERFFAITTDLIGTPTELVTEAGEVAWHAQRTLWGTTTWNRNATTHTPLRFPGQYHDPETGLHHNYYRHYDPETARYTTPDPLGLAPAPNPTTYVHNPHTWTDPLGLAPRCLNETGKEGKDAHEN
jgi:RHS repeat-associated protein